MRATISAEESPMSMVCVKHAPVVISCVACECTPRSRVKRIPMVSYSAIRTMSANYNITAVALQASAGQKVPSYAQAFQFVTG